MKENDFCMCKTISSITIGFEDDWGYWDVCTKCKKKIKDSHHFYNHYDGKDHEEFYGPNGEIYVNNEDEED